MLNKLQQIVQKDERLVAGIMSGTSLDGIDVAFCKIKGCGEQTSLTLAGFESIPFSTQEKNDILRLCTPETGDVASICYMNKYLGIRFGHAVVDAANACGIAMADVDFIASHGQTIFHMPKDGATLQIGELADIAAVTGTVVTGDFRPSDMAYGGEGAPLVPFVDYILYHTKEKNRALVNIGGIGNITVLAKDGTLDDLNAFDTGPGNMIVDEIMRMITNGEKHYDKNGDMAATGTIHDEFFKYVAEKDDFLAQLPPKTTGRELYSQSFTIDLYDFAKRLSISDADILATLTDYTAYTIWKSVEDYIPIPVDEILISGGGVHNQFMMNRLTHYFGERVKRFSELGLSDDAKEAAAFAILGNEFLHGNFNNAKRATNATKNVVMGKLVLPS